MGKLSIPYDIVNVSEITDLDECRHLWMQRAAPFGDFGFRKALADQCGMEPHFLKAGDTVLPTGVHNDIFYFYGGLKYNEHNGFIGSGNEREILDWISGTKFRLLAWDSDPLAFSDDMASYDVPFNQYWVQDIDYWSYITSLPRKTERKIRYLGRKYSFERRITGNIPLIEEFIDKTIDAFKKRNAPCAYETMRDVVMLACNYLEERGKLYVKRVLYKGEIVGLAVMVEGVPTKFLLSLYQRSPSDISDGNLVAALTSAPIDALRGSFTLKKKYGLHPRPSYALVRDPTWVKKDQTDLDESEILLLYGRKFGEPQCP